MRHLLRRFISISLALLLTAGLLQGGALAADCTHAELKNGVCQNESCKEIFAAAVGDTLYTSLDDALTAAKTEEADAVSVFTDLKDKTLELGTISLVVEAGDSLVFENCTFFGTNENQVLLNYGSLILKNVTVENTEGSFALFSECTEGTDLLELSIVGGSYTGKDYGIGLKQMMLQLNGTAEVVDEEEIINVPVVSGETAGFRLEDSVIEVLCDLGDETSYRVDCVYPGVFAYAPEYEGTQPKDDWFDCVQLSNTYQAAEKRWELPGSIAAAVTLDHTVFTYNGKAQAPAITAKLYDQALENEHYSVSYANAKGEPVEQAINVGTYKLTVTGEAPYSESFEKEFEIVAAKPVIKWDLESEHLAYTGESAVLTSKATVELANGETYTGEIDYAYREEGTNAFLDGLPKAHGSYEVQASVKADGNYTAAETEKLLKLTVGRKADVQLTLEVTIPEEGHTYTGSEICPAVTVKDGETVIPAEEYSVEYQNNVNAGTATVSVKAKESGNYSFTDLTASFEIKKADGAALTISGKPATVTYGDQEFQLSAVGGISGEAVVWSVTEGGNIASVSESGTVSVSGAGKVTIRAAQSGGANYYDRSVDVSFDVKPVALTVESVTAENKTYDGSKTVKITGVVLSGVLASDDVSVAVGDVQAELSDTKAGVYDQVTVTNLSLAGTDAANYTLTQPTAPVKTDVTVIKADVPSALAEIKAAVSVDTTEIVVENLAAGMPADAGKITYTNKTQDTDEGSEVIVLDWKVDENGKLTSKVVNGKAGDRILYDVKITSENYKETAVRVVVSFDTQKLDTSAVTVTPKESSITYDGKEHKPAVEVKHGDTVLKADTDYEVTYPKDCVSVGEKELTVTFKGNYSGTAAGKYTIAKATIKVTGVQVENKTYDGTTTAKVTATISGAVSGENVKVTATGIFADKNSGSNKTVNVTYKLEGEDAGNYELESASGTTTAKISPITASTISSQISGLSLSNADSGNLSTLRSVVTRANTALEDTGLSSSEKSALSNVKWSAEDMISRVESAAAAASTESVRKSADITEENVTVADKALLEKAQSDLNSALTSYSGNYTTAEENEIQSKKTRIAEALTVITRVQSAQTLIDALPAQLTEENVADPAVKTSVEDAKEVYDGLSDYEKSLLGEDEAAKLTSAVEAISNAQTTSPEKDDANILTYEAPEEGEGFKIPGWILVVAVIAAGLCGGGLFVYKRKQEENEYNW